MEDRLSPRQGPSDNLASETTKLASRKKCRQLRNGRWYATEYLVSADARQNYAVSLEPEDTIELHSSRINLCLGSRDSGEQSSIRSGPHEILLRYVYMTTVSASPFFNLREVGPLVPVWFVVIIVRNCIHPRRSRFLICNE